MIPHEERLIKALIHFKLRNTLPNGKPELREFEAEVAGMLHAVKLLYGRDAYVRVALAVMLPVQAERRARILRSQTVTSNASVAQW